MAMKEAYRLLAVGVSVSLLAWPAVHSEVGESAQPAEKPSVATLVRGWQGQFGGVEFSDSLLFKRMVYVHPQPEARFTPFVDEVLSAGIQSDHDRWMRHFFKGDFLEQLKTLKPSGYYLNEGRTEPGLLLYKTQYGQDAVSLQENFNVVFLTVRPPGFNPGEPVTPPDISRLLSELTNIDSGREGEKRGEFVIPGGVKSHRVFVNHKGRQIHEIQDWRDDIVGFVADQGICLLLFKVDRQAPRAAMGLPYDFDWLNKGLFKKDGSTLVSPQLSGAVTAK